MERPTSVTVFGVLNIVFAVLGFCGSGFSAVVLLAARQGPIDPANPMQEMHPVMQAWLAIGTVLGVIFCIVLLFAGIGLLRMRSWGRTLSLAYSVYGVISTAIGMVMSWIFFVAPVMEKFGGKAGPEAAGMVGGAIGAVVGGCLGVIYPVLLWYFMTRPHVVAAFSGTASMPSELFPQPADTSFMQPDSARESGNPYLSPMTESAPAPGAFRPQDSSESVIQTFIPSKNGAALLSYYLGLFSLFPCLGFPLGVVAVYYGVRGLRNFRQDPTVRGRTHAWVGVICGSLFGLLNFLALVGGIVGLIAEAGRR